MTLVVSNCFLPHIQHHSHCVFKNLSMSLPEEMTEKGFVVNTSIQSVIQEQEADLSCHRAKGTAQTRHQSIPGPQKKQTHPIAESPDNLTRIFLDHGRKPELLQKTHASTESLRYNMPLILYFSVEFLLLYPCAISMKRIRFSVYLIFFSHLSHISII